MYRLKEIGSISMDKVEGPCLFSENAISVSMWSAGNKSSFISFFLYTAHSDCVSMWSDWTKVWIMIDMVFVQEEWRVVLK